MRKMRLPEWIRTKHNPTALHGVKSMLRSYGLSTVCEEARCPNKSECFAKPTATFMILGSRCTRSCGFCSVHVENPPQSPLKEKLRRGLEVDPDEPRRVALAAGEMGLKYVVITSVTRDDLPDGGAVQFAETVRAVRRAIPRAKVEVLVPDFKGETQSLRTVLDAGPDVLGHNVETVPRLYPEVRPQADYKRSIGLLRASKAARADIFTKSGLMLGLGEGEEEVIGALRDLRKAGCDFLTLGQYLRPSRENLPVREFIRPETFDILKDRALTMGFRHVASAPLVRSSMNAEEMFENA